MKRLLVAAILVALVFPATALAARLTYTQAKHAAITRGEQIARRPVHLDSLTHMWANKWYAQLSYRRGASTYGCLMDMYVNLRNGRIVTRLLSNGCY